MATIEIGLTCGSCEMDWSSCIHAVFTNMMCVTPKPGPSCPGPGTKRLVDEAEYQKIIEIQSAINAELTVQQVVLLQVKARLANAVVLDAAKCTPEAVYEWCKSVEVDLLCTWAIIFFLKHAGVK